MPRSAPYFTALAALFFWMTGFAPASYGGQSGAIVSCSSDDGHRHYCDANTRGGVRLLQQRSDSPCREGETWGFDERGIWVDRGCRADFSVGRRGSDRDGYDHDRDSDRRRDRDSDRGHDSDVRGTVSCSSDDGRRHYCDADTRDGVRLSRQLSDTPCREGETWGSDRRGVWVDRGCRAEFELGGGQRSDRRSQSPDTISCSSDDGGRHYCNADTRGGVRLSRQISGSECREGYSWGSDSRGVWVDHGCRGEFALGSRYQ
jgi:Protein of unknown function (DUF3011)